MISNKSRQYVFLAAAAAAVVVTAQARAEDAELPSLERFLTASERYAPSNQEARAVAKERAAQGTQAVDRLLPTFSATAGYTRNQYDVVARFPDGAGGVHTATITPKDQLDATLAIDAPLLDVGNFSRISSARADERASEAQAAVTSDDTSRDVGRAYYQLVAAHAVIASAEHALATSEQNLRTVESRLKGGLASELDAHRARAEIERNRKAVSDAELLRKQAARKLRSFSGLDPNGHAPALPRNTDAEPPLQAWLGGVEALPAVRAASEQAHGAEALQHAAVAAFVPSIAGRASERFTNAPGFGFSPAWAAGVTATWKVDLGALAAVHAQDAAVEASTAVVGRTRQDARDAIEDAFDQVETERAAATSARAEEEASVHAAEVARVRYDAGTATHLELLEAERDAFSAEVSRVQAEADLAYARFALHLAAGHLDGVHR